MNQSNQTSHKILVLDGNSLVYRAYFGTAFSKQILTNSSGLPVNAILTFTKMLHRFIKQYQPTHILIAFDSKGKTVRHEQLPSYKGTRSATPEELLTQIPLIKNLLDLLQIRHYEIPGYEADDIIASATASWPGQFLVVSSDQDIFQLVNDHVTMIVPQNRSRPDVVLTHQNFYEQMTYHPQQVPDLKGLAGDSSDNLPGVRGVGKKGACKLLEQYPTLEDIYQNLTSFSASLQTKLTRDKANAFLCKQMAQLITTIKLPFTLADLQYRAQSSPELITFLQKLELWSLVKMFQNQKSENPAPKATKFTKIIF